MRIAVVHYHLEPGGVTRVIENTIDSFEKYDEQINFVVLTGRKYSGSKLKNVKVVEGLDYSSSKECIDAKILADRMETAASEGLNGKPDLWHIHNHSLGKNPSLTKSTSILAGKSYPILLHPHDFAEDGRPSNFLELKGVYDIAYPTSSIIHYAVLNHRDYSFVKKLLNGKHGCVHLLANSISPVFPDKESEKPNLPENFFLYPVRAVRRKNLGELSLIATVHNDKFFANSLGPTNPNFKPRFDRWKEFSEQLNLPVSFAFGEQLTCSFSRMMESSSGIICTSIAEGFGLGFLEPWTFNKCLSGRNIPEITNDFSSLGIQLDHMYNRLDVNIDHLEDETILKSKIKIMVKKLFSDYQKEMPKFSFDIAYASIVKDKYMDFGRIDESLQEDVITSISKSKTVQKETRQQVKLNMLDDSSIKKNHQATLQQFSSNSYVKKLKTIYLQLTNGKNESVEFANGKILLESFLTPERINLLRT